MKSIVVRLTSLLVLCAICVSALASCSKKIEEIPIEKTAYYLVEMDVEDYGTIEMTLVRSAAPITVDNFVQLALNDFYDGLTFIRAQKGFVIQGGEGSERDTKNLKPITGEFASNGYYSNSISHTEGVISMARSNDMNSATSQFFITIGDASYYLDGNYAAFGYIHTESMSIVHAIAKDMFAYGDPQMGFVADESRQPVITDVRVTPIMTKNEIDSSTGTDVINVEMDVENYGTIKMKLLRSAAPYTVSNFIKLANDNLYDGLTFIRAQEGFVIQGGKPSSDVAATLAPIPGEFFSNGFSKNTIEHAPGVISMARTQDPDSATSEFFITIGDATFLDGNYAAFGYIDSESMDIVYAIAEDMIPYGDPDMGFVDDVERQPVITDVRIIP